MVWDSIMVKNKEIILDFGVEKRDVEGLGLGKEGLGWK